MEGVHSSQARVSSKLAVMAMRAAGPVVVLSRSWRVAAGVAGKKENPVGGSAGVPGDISPCASVTEAAREGQVAGLLALLGA